MVKRPIMRYHGGKWKLAPWISSHFPEHRIYVEPFGGAASILLRKPRSYAEIYNDLDGEVVNVFRQYRDNGAALCENIWATPFSREEYITSYQPTDDALEQARRTVMRSFMGFGSAAVTLRRHTTKRFTNPATGFRSNSNRSGTTPAHDWKNYAEASEAFIERLRGVVIENKDATSIILQHDTPETLHYLDPPYVAASRDKGSDYAHEMTNDQHCELAKMVHSLKGMVIISGYNSLLYDSLYKGWNRTERIALADGAAKRTEVLWMNYEPDSNLFSGANQ